MALLGLVQRFNVAAHHTRWNLPRTRWGRLMIHRFTGPDEDRECHDHPWDFYTYPLRGYYEEELDLVTGDRSVSYTPRRRWTLRRAEHSHRFLGPHDWLSKGGPRRPLWTIVWATERRQNWGFWCRPHLAYTLVRSPADVLGWIADALDRPKWVKVNWERYVNVRRQ